MTSNSGASLRETCSHPTGQAQGLGASRFDQARNEVEMVVHDIWRDARMLATASSTVLSAYKSDLVEARESLNDAIAKAERLKVAA